MDALEKEAMRYLKDATRHSSWSFAVVKETARRFKDNSQISVTASALDREFSGIKAYVSLKETNQFGKINGMLQEKKLPGTWFIMMFN
jgi:preprotein translocase subunit SecA